MPSFQWLILSIGLSILVSVAFGWWISSNTPSVIGEATLSQSPLTYILLVIFLVMIGFIFSRVYNRISSDHSFSFRGFLNVGFAAMIVGGVVHEVVHMILLRHPTQFQVHFGDPTAIFSTCCLAPGELPNEEIAYGIQFIVMLLWFFINRKLIFHSNQPFHSPAEKKVSASKNPHGSHNDVWEEKKDLNEHSIETEWEKSRNEIRESFARIEK